MVVYSTLLLYNKIRSIKVIIYFYINTIFLRMEMIMWDTKVKLNSKIS